MLVIGQGGASLDPIYAKYRASGPAQLPVGHRRAQPILKADFSGTAPLLDEPSSFFSARRRT